VLSEAGLKAMKGQINVTPNPTMGYKATLKNNRSVMDGGASPFN
jgi:hypothetical protein